MKPINGDAMDKLGEIKDRLKGLSRLVLNAADGPSETELIDVAVLLDPISDELEAWFSVHINGKAGAA